MPQYPQHPSFPIPATSLWSLLFDRDEASHEQARKNLFQDAHTGRSYDLESLREACLDFSAGLRSTCDFRKGDVLAVFSPNNIDYPVVCLGALHAGGAFAPVSAALTVTELAWQLKDSGAKVFATHPSCLAVATEAALQVGFPTNRIYLLGEEAIAKPTHFTKIPRGSGQRATSSVKVDSSDLAALTYSSGTTGLPKGVRLTQENLVAVILANVVADAEGPPGYKLDKDWNARAIAVLPFSHIYGIVFLMMQPIHERRTAVVMPKFELEAFCSTIEKYRITLAYVVPPILVLLAKHPAVQKYDLSSLSGLSSAAAPLTKELIEDVYRRLKVPVRQCYGLSETSPTITVQAFTRWQKMGSVGTLVPNMTLKWMSPDGKEVPAGQEGEMWVKGPNVFQSYLNRPDATEEAFSDGGWFRTGDVGFQDPEGNCYITDRLKELIKYKGFQVAPAELEGKLLSHPMILDVAVLGVYQEEEASEVPRAFVVSKPGTTGDDKLAKEIVTWMDGQVSHHKKLRGGVHWIDSVPKSPTGKILRRTLREKYAISSVPKKARM